jgi:hypothetical protein
MKRLLAITLILTLLLPAAALADSEQYLGRWCFYWDTRPMNDEYNNGKPMMSFIVNNYDFYIYEDGTVYMIAASIPKNSSFKLNYPQADGLWVDNGDGTITIKVLSNTYKAELDKSGRMLVYMTEKIPYPFYKIPSYDFFAEQTE